MLIFLRVVPPEGCGRNISNERRDKKRGLAQLFLNICLNHLRPLQKHERLLQKYLRSTCFKSTNRILKPFFPYSDFFGPIEFSEDHRRDVYG